MIFSSNRSFLLRKRMTEEFWNQGYVIIVLNRALLSSIRFYRESVNVCVRRGKVRGRKTERESHLIKPQPFKLIRYRF